MPKGKSILIELRRYHEDKFNVVLSTCKDPPNRALCNEYHKDRNVGLPWILATYRVYSIDRGVVSKGDKVS